CARSEQATWSHQEHDNKNEKNADLAKRLSEKEPGQTFSDTDQQRPHERARHGAHAAEYDDRKGNENEGITHSGINIVGWDQKAGGDRNARGAKAKRHRVDMGNVDAGELSTEFLPGNSANCTAGVGKSHYHPQCERDSKDRDKTDNARKRQKRESKINRLKCIRNIDRPRIGAKCVKKRGRSMFLMHFIRLILDSRFW